MFYSPPTPVFPGSKKLPPGGRGGNVKKGVTIHEKRQKVMECLLRRRKNLRLGSTAQHEFVKFPKTLENRIVELPLRVGLGTMFGARGGLGRGLVRASGREGAHLRFPRQGLRLRQLSSATGVSTEARNHMFDVFGGEASSKRCTCHQTHDFVKTSIFP